MTHKLSALSLVANNLPSIPLKKGEEENPPFLRGIDGGSTD
ncbi:MULTISPECIES: hypothetical protein [Pseudanabaena]|uniref:Uncharacterized protein n=1 Tax=Pseudanabaena catenata USMAC16 TaxID=1855837 RepID=A0A9X4MC10_9CYAN|nr:MULTISPECIES: hypothetical protein [Pseudanabaena]MDG3496623.1 hypothetical protein [Pseudanabaena catenata USMAC16]